MKFVFASLLLFGFAANAMPKKASIDGALSHRYDENYEETQRSLASQIEPVEVEESHSGAPDSSPAGQSRHLERSGQQGIQYWKY